VVDFVLSARPPGTTRFQARARGLAFRERGPPPAGCKQEVLTFTYACHLLPVYRATEIVAIRQSLRVPVRHMATVFSPIQSGNGGATSASGFVRSLPSTILTTVRTSVTRGGLRKASAPANAADLSKMNSFFC